MKKLDEIKAIPEDGEFIVVKGKMPQLSEEARALLKKGDRARRKMYAMISGWPLY